MKKYIVITLTALLLQGCASYKGYIIIREEKTDVVSVKKEGFIKKKDITGKGCDFYANKECDFEYSVDKDGKKTYKFSSKKDSFLTKLFGGWKVLKPDNVNMGGK